MRLGPLLRISHYYSLNRFLTSSPLFPTATRTTTALAMSTWGSHKKTSTDGNYTPPQVWKWEQPDPESINRPTAGARFDRELPVGKHPIQLYSL